MSEWTHISDDTATYKKCPYGEIANNYRWKKRDENDDDPGEDVFAFHQKSWMTPGKNKYSDCDSDSWHNEWMKAVHKHDESEFNNVSLWDSDPDDGSGGTIGVTIGYGTADLSWTFETDGTVYKSISGARPIWEVHEIFGTPRRQTQELEPGSVIIMDDDVEDTRKMTTLRFEGHFEHDNLIDEYYLYHYWDLYLENYIQD